MRGRHHDSRFEGILKMKLQASDASAPEGLQSQNLSRPENRLSVNGLAIVHGRPIIRVLPGRNAGALVPPMLRALVPRHLADRRPRLPRLPGVAVSQGAFGEVAR